jgi:hypothetical protein
MDELNKKLMEASNLLAFDLTKDIWDEHNESLTSFGILHVKLAHTFTVNFYASLAGFLLRDIVLHLSPQDCNKLMETLTQQTIKFTTSLLNNHKPKEVH